MSSLSLAGLEILNTAMHISGNPVPFDIHSGAVHEEYLVLLHTKAPEYVNWAVRMDRATKRITHVSAGPILRNQDYRNEVSLKYHWKPLKGLACLSWLWSRPLCMRVILLVSSRCHKW